MIKPTRENWERFTPNGLVSFAQRLHPQPRFYKYLWQVWTPTSESEGEDFFRFGPRFTTAQYVVLREGMLQAGEPGWVYNRQLLPLGAGTPFDPKHPRWQGVLFAPAWDDDSDPVWEGHK